MALSLPLLIYLCKYLMDLIEAQSSTLMWASKNLERMGLHGKFHWLSIYISLFPYLILTMWPTCPGARFLYSGTGPSDLDHVASLSGRPSPVQRVPVLASLHLCQKMHRELLGALAVLHAGVIGIEGAAGTVDDALDDDGIQSWISLDVRNLGRDERINLVTGNPVCKSDE